MEPISERLLNIIRTKGTLNNEVADAGLSVFARLKSLLQQTEKSLRHEINKEGIKIKYTDRGIYETELRVSDDVLIFIMHTNAFVFDPSNPIHKTGYLSVDPERATCAMISVYNFLSDSLNFERKEDIGQLIGRVFINKEKHFFVEGKKQLGVLFNDFQNAVATDDNIQLIIENFLIHCLEIDINVPPFELMKQITVNDAINYTIQTAAVAGKRLGFKFQSENPDFES